MATITKADLAEQLFAELGLNKREAGNVIDTVFEEIRQNLEQGESIKLSGFGNFDLIDKGSRPGRNPKTKKDVMITPRRVVTFRAGQKLKAKVKEYGGTEIN